MLRIEDMFLTDLEGTLMYRDIPLAYFNIKDKKLVEYRRIRKEKTLYPPELSGLLGDTVTYFGINQFFRERVVLDGSQNCREFLANLGLKHYDFNAIVNILHGLNNIDNWWIATDDFHPAWKEILDERKACFTIETIDIDWKRKW